MQGYPEEGIVQPGHKKGHPLGNGAGGGAKNEDGLKDETQCSYTSWKQTGEGNSQKRIPEII